MSSKDGKFVSFKLDGTVYCDREGNHYIISPLDAEIVSLEELIREHLLPHSEAIVTITVGDIRR